jgi:tRNA-dihydrouridine synthase
MPALTDSWQLGNLTIPNRVVLAPLAGIGNWFVRLQAKRYGAGLAISEMISSHAIHYGNPKTLDELLVVRPEEKAGGPVALQLFGGDPAIMREAAARAAEVGADAIDINMGCPVPKVTRTGAGVALLSDPDRAVAVARAAAEGSGLPVVVKLRAGRRIGQSEGSTSRCGSPTRRRRRHLVPSAFGAGPPQGRPDYELAAQLAAELPCR